MKANVTDVMNKIEETCQKVNRDMEDITVVVVTKYVDEQKAKEVVDLGLNHLGENRDYQFIQKHEAIGEEATWHFVGTLQSRKVRDIINQVDYIHSLDRKSLAKEINKRAHQKVKCFVQVNVAEEESKHGLAVEEVVPFIESLQSYENIEVFGLMTMAPHTDDEEQIRSVFKTLRSLQEKVKGMDLSYAPCEHLSMGMSNDYTIAIEEGATFLRLGSSIVGSE